MFCPLVAIVTHQAANGWWWLKLKIKPKLISCDCLLKWIHRIHVKTNKQIKIKNKIPVTHWGLIVMCVCVCRGVGMCVRVLICRRRSECRVGAQVWCICTWQTVAFVFCFVFFVTCAHLFTPADGLQLKATILEDHIRPFYNVCKQSANRNTQRKPTQSRGRTCKLHTISKQFETTWRPLLAPY